MVSTTFRGSDLTDLSSIIGKQHQITGETPVNNAIARGYFNLTKTFSDVFVHLSDFEELEQVSVSCERTRELTIGVLIEGKLEFSLDGQTIELVVLPGERPTVFAFNILRPAIWKRELSPGNKVKKALVCIPHVWLRKRPSINDSFLQNLVLRHNLFFSVPSDFKLHNLASKMLDQGKNQDSDLELEGLALILISESLKFLKEHSLPITQHSFESGSPNNQALRIAQFIEEEIISKESFKPLDLNAIANQLGLSISTAQRQFKQQFDITIMEYIRTRRLENARTQLLSNTSIGEVAYMAGYTQKYFGFSPGDVCRPTLENL